MGSQGQLYCAVFTTCSNKLGTNFELNTNQTNCELNTHKTKSGCVTVQDNFIEHWLQLFDQTKYVELVYSSYKLCTDITQHQHGTVRLNWLFFLHLCCVVRKLHPSKRTLMKSFHRGLHQHQQQHLVDSCNAQFGAIMVDKCAAISHLRSYCSLTSAGGGDSPSQTLSDNLRFPGIMVL